MITGMVFSSSKNHKDYADKIVKLLQDVTLQIQFGEEARLKVKSKFSIDIVASQSADFYLKTIQNNINRNNS